MGFETGIYFDMPEADYHAVPALSNSGVQDINVSPLTYWTNHLDPEREEQEETDGTINGSAVHARVLEGEEQFYSRYAVLPDRDDYGRILDKLDDLKAECECMGLKKGGTRMELAERLHEAGCDAVLWPLVMKEWEQQAAGRTAIKRDWADRIELSAQIVLRHPDAQRAVTGGYPEVSIFWREAETGTPMKARVDYLKARALVEVKSFLNGMKRPVDVAIARTIADRKYHVQAYVYLQAVEAAKALVSQGRVYGEVESGWLEAFAASEPHACYFLFIENAKIPNVRVREFRRDEGRKGSSVNAYWWAAEAEFQRGLYRYIECMDHFGPDIPWAEPVRVSPFKDEEFPLWMME